MGLDSPSSCEAMRPCRWLGLPSYVWLAAIVASAAVGIFAPTLTASLVWDDPLLLELIGERVRSGGLLALLSSDFRLGAGADALGYYRPLVLLSLWLDLQVGAGQPLFFHLTNVLLHGAVSALVFLVIRHVAASERTAFLGGALFAVHPVHTESVAFVSGRTDLLAGLFTLLAAWSWLRGRTGPFRGRWVTAGTFFFTLALFSKEVAFALPPVLLACAALAGAEPPRWRRLWRDNRAWLGGWALAGALALTMRFVAAGADFGLTAHGVAEADWAALSPAMMLGMWVRYLRLLVVPWPLQAHYGTADLALSWTSAGAAGVFLALCLLEARRPRRLGALALAWSVGFLLPVSGLVPLATAPVAERFLYLPSVGAALALGSLWSRLTRPGSATRTLGALGVVAHLGLMGSAAVAHSRVWRANHSLYSHILAVAPDAWFAHYNLGNDHLARGRYELAIEAYREAARLRPRFAEAPFNMGVAQMRQGRCQEAAANFKAALANDPKHIQALVNLGICLGQTGSGEEAAQALRRALEIAPGDAKALYNLGIVHVRLGQTQAAREAWERLVIIDQDLALGLKRLLRASERQ